MDREDGMDDVLVTIGGQPVYRKDRATGPESPKFYRDARDASGYPLATTEMSPSGWISGGNEEAIEAGLPFLGAVLTVILFAIIAVILAKRARQATV